jgi:hypothetical protein
MVKRNNVMEATKYSQDHYYEVAIKLQPFASVQSVKSFSSRGLFLCSEMGSRKSAGLGAVRRFYFED